MKKDDDGREFVRCRPVAGDFKPRQEGPRDDLFAAKPLLEEKKAFFLHSLQECARRDEKRDRTK